MATQAVENIMATTLERLRGLVEVNTIVGQPIHTEGGEVILPVSKVSLGVLAGGAQYECGKKGGSTEAELPFGGGGGAGASLHPVGFLAVSGNQVRVLPICSNSSAVDRILETIPQVLREVKNLLREETREAPFS